MSTAPEDGTADHRSRTPRRLGWLGALLAATAILFWWPCLAGGKAPVAAVYQQEMAPFGQPLPPPSRAWDALLWDSVAQFYPWRSLLRRGLEHGELPLWDPYQYCGYPLVGNGQSALFYPPNWLLWWIPADYFMGLSLALHWLLAGLFTFYLARMLGLRSGAAALAGIVYQCSGFMITWCELPTVVNTMTWLPAAWLGVELIFRQRRWGVPLLAISLGMAVLAGHLQFAAYIWLATAVYALVRALGRWFARRPAPVLPLIGAVVLGLGLGAPQLLPAWELGAASPRGEQQVSAAGWSFQQTRALLPAELITFVWPTFVGDPATGKYEGFSFTEHCGFAGVSALVLALLGLAWRRDRWALLYAVGAAAALSIAMAGPLARALYFWVPKLGQAGNFARILGVYTLCLAMLAGMGLDSLLRWVNRHLTAGPTGRGAVATLLSGAAVAILLLELVPWGWRFLPLSPRDQIYPQTELTRALKRASSPQFRCLAITPRKAWSIFHVPKALLPPNADTIYGWHSPQGYDSLSLATYREYAEQAEGANVSPRENGNMMLLQNLNSRLLDEAAVRWIASLEPLSAPGLAFSGEHEGVYLYERPHAPPRVRGAAPQSGAAAITGGSSNTLRVMTGSGSLVVADAYYPGWLAFSDGKPAPIQRHEVFREVPLDGKPHQVWMAYYPGTVVGGIFLGLLSLMALAAVVAGRREL